MEGLKVLLVNLPREGEVKDVANTDSLLYDFMDYPPHVVLADDIQRGFSPSSRFVIRDVIRNPSPGWSS
jgi:hypothetical protein